MQQGLQKEFIGISIPEISNRNFSDVSEGHTPLLTLGSFITMYSYSGRQIAEVEGGIVKNFRFVKKGDKISIYRQ